MNPMPFLLLLAIVSLTFPAYAQEAKTYNFGTRPHAIPDNTIADEPVLQAPPVPTQAAPHTSEPINTPSQSSKPSSRKKYGYVYSPKHNGIIQEHDLTQNNEKAEQLVRFFIGTCLKYHGRNEAMTSYMDSAFAPMDDERKALFAPVVDGNANTHYWDVMRDNMLYVVAKNTTNGKCDVVAKDGASTAIHKELKAVMDGLTLTHILKAKTDYEKIPNLNKEVSIIDIEGHPLEKQLGIVATSKIKEDGDNVAAILTLFVVPQEGVDIK